MKKVLSTAVVAAIMAAGTTTQAMTIYKQDGLTYKLKGDWQIQLRQDTGHEQDLDVEYDDLELKNAIEYEISEKVKAFGELDFGFKNAADKSNDDAAPHLEEAYIGFAFDKVKVSMGKTTNGGYEFGIAGFVESVVAEDAFDEVGRTDGDDLIKVEADFGMVQVVASYELAADSEASDHNGEFYDIFVGARFGGLSLGAAYQNYEAYMAPDEEGNVMPSSDVNIYGVSIAYDAKVVSVAADYSIAEDDQTIYNLFVSVPINTITLGAGYVIQDFDDDAEEDINGYYANVVYKIPSQKNVSVFAEVGANDEDGSDMGFLLGGRIKF